MSNILAAIATLGEILKLLKAAYDLYRQAKKEGWLEEGKELHARIKEAKTDEERRALVRELARRTPLP